MPILESTDFSPPWIQFNGHVQTILPGALRRVKGVDYVRERIDTPDGDFLDLDWSTNKNSRIAIVSHGLEGDTTRPYVRGMVRALNSSGWDALAWNFRGCSQEMNRARRFYHSGETSDLDWVVKHARGHGNYQSIALVGFSLGGNVTLKYLGELGAQSPIERAVTFSVPLDLYKSCLQITKPSNFIYARRFLNRLKGKIRRKAKSQPNLLDTGRLGSIQTIYDFDDLYTAPLHGFNGARDYYARCSSINYLSKIKIPTLIINARNDPFLPKECYPNGPISELSQVFFESPESGGHCGFATSEDNQTYWSEKRAIEFLG